MQRVELGEGVVFAHLGGQRFHFVGQRGEIDGRTRIRGGALKHAHACVDMLEFLIGLLVFQALQARGDVAGILLLRGHGLVDHRQARLHAGVRFLRLREARRAAGDVAGELFKRCEGAGFDAIDIGGRGLEIMRGGLGDLIKPRYHIR